MVIKETLKDGRTLHYSDENLKIRQIETGIVYETAVDILPYSYEETDEPIPDPPDPEDEATAEDYEAALNKLGVET